MYLKRLEIQGFKSFANNTVLTFEPGITAVVGPNGSGKSNVADAVRWVLGEQSKSLLRGKKAEDVIFVGSDKKSRASVASVSVVFDNKDKRLPLDSAEVVFTRKLHRDGTSEYLINNQPSRLMDIVESLNQAGFAQSRYTVIGQGVIDQFLLQGPAEIKSLVEEAAGIAPYYSKRDRTLRRLETTRDNLTQVGALISEIEPRLRSLRRQAKKLEQRSHLEKQWRELLSGRLAHIFSTLSREKSSLEKDINSLEEKISFLQKQVDDSFNAIENQDDESTKRSQSLAQLQRDLSEEQRKRDQINSSLSEVRSKIRVESVGSNIDVGAIQSRVSDQERQFENIDRQAKELEYNLNQTEDDINEIVAILNTEKPDLVARLRMIVDKFVSGQREFLERLKRQKGDAEKILEKSRAELSAYTSKPENRIDSLQQLEQQIISELAGQEKKIAELQQKLNHELESVSSYTTERRSADQKIRSLESDLSRLRSQQNDLRVSHARVETKLEEEERKAVEDLGPNYRETVSLVQPIVDASVDEQVAYLKKQLEMIGGLDEMTLQEYEETEDRYGYLTRQVADLEKASVDLEKVLDELEVVIKDRFNKAYNIISSKFGEYFRMLFNGGRASMSILREKSSVSENEENVEGDLESDGEKVPGSNQIVGIEVKATPPGKKLASIAALSGGERSLTTIAMLMAMLDAFPSPFVVLDEADAALDESNSIRFAKILDHLSDRTQFITITHNRETMRRAHTLYGVTMGDDSVSKILSIKLDESLRYAKE